MRTGALPGESSQLRLPTLSRQALVGTQVLGSPALPSHAVEGYAK
jgi:hypothetical protein